MTAQRRVTRRDFLKLLGSGLTVLAFGSIFGFSALLPPASNGRGVRGGGEYSQQASAQSALGRWSAGPNTPVASIHMTNLVNGKVLCLAGSGYSSLYEPQNYSGPYFGFVFDPSNESITNITFPEDLFCCGQAVLPNGNVVCAGGTIRYDTSDVDGLWKGHYVTYEYNNSTGKMVKVQDMAAGRWYPYMVPTDNEEIIMTVGGFDHWGCYNRLVEIYNYKTKTWRISYDPNTTTTYTVGSCNTTNPNKPSDLPTYGGTGVGGVGPPLALYPRVLFMPTGLVAVVGQSASTRTWNPSTGKWRFAGSMATSRAYGSMVLLPLQNSTSEKGRILAVNGSPSSSTNAIRTVELLTPNPSFNYETFSITQIGNCNYGRRHCGVAYLPDGKLVFIGGTLYGNSTPQAYYNAEIYDPIANTWEAIGGMNIRRIYHTTSILLPDGRVWIAGSQDAKSYWETRSEYFVPAYYDVSRPTISSEPQVGDYGTSITIPTPDAVNIQKASLISLSSFTHAHSSALRFIWLNVKSRVSGSSVTVEAPINAKIAPKGWYYIHILDSQGIPSKAKIVSIPGTGAGTGDTTPPTQVVGLIATAVNSVQINLSWTANTNSDLKHYNVYRGRTAGFPVNVQSDTPIAQVTTNAYSDTGLNASTTYYYKVAAVDTSNNIGSVSAEDSATTTTPSYRTIYSVVGNTSSPLYVSSTAGYRRYGETLTTTSSLIGKSIKRISVILNRTAITTTTTPPPVYIRVRKGDDSIIATLATLNVLSDISATDRTFTYDLPSAYTLAANDKVLVEWEGTGSDQEKINVRRYYNADYTRTFDSNNTRQAVMYSTRTYYNYADTYDLAGDWSSFI